MIDSILELPSLQILHLSDLHFGIRGHKPLWPTFKHAFYEDLRRLHRKTGPWQLVIFSGDLTQSASVDEFDGLTAALKELWVEFDRMGFCPSFLPIPGNHDLQRPEKLNPEATVMASWGARSDLRELFWTNASNPYRTLIEKTFENYLTWMGELLKNGIPLIDLVSGELPGDCAAFVSAEGLRVGIVGLNSAWMQLSGSDFSGRLEIDVRQINALTSDDPDKWSAANDFNLIITHHPVSWLSHASQSQWRSEINVRNRFDAHLCGHMHELSTNVSSVNGSSRRLVLQAASLFGLENYGTEKVDRRHGYSLISLSKKGDKVLRQWPRLAHRMGDESRKFIPDPDHYLDDDQEYVSYHLTQSTTSVALEDIPPDAAAPTALLMEIGDPAEPLSIIKRDIPLNPSHIEVRRIEQGVVLGELNTGRPVWIVSDWGLSTDDFIRTIQHRLPNETAFYQIDIHSYLSREDLLAGITQQMGYSFEQLVQYLDRSGPCLLVLDDAPIGHVTDAGKFEAEIERLTELIKSFAKEVRVVVTSRLMPAATSLRVVALKVLDEVDTALFIRNRNLVGKQIATPEFVAAMHRHTDGIPVRLEAALEYVQLVGLSELSTINSDVFGKQAGSYDSSPALEAAVRDLQADPSTERAFQLLKALAIFPAGERFGAVKRFNGPNGFYPPNAQLLIERALVDKVETGSIDPVFEQDSARALVVRRPVREYLYATLSPADLRSLNKKALQLYFGAEWQIGNIRPPASLRFDNPKQGASVLSNATFMVMRVIKDAVEVASPSKLLEAINLTTAFCASLINGEHFRAAYLLCEDAMSLMVPSQDQLDVSLDLTLLKRQWAQAARMIGKAAQSRDISLENIETTKSKNYLQSVFLNLAMCYETLNEPQNAVDAANRCLEIDASTTTALHARVIIAANDPAELDQEGRLKDLEKEARKRDALIVANNIALKRAEQEKNPIDGAKMAEIVASSIKGTDNYYNSLRATILIANGSLKEGKALDNLMMSKLIQAYHYLYSQRFDNLFNKCHATLWAAFERLNQTDNLLRLFRHSSFMWRLRDKSHLETPYLEKLRARLSDQIETGFRGTLSVEMGYFLARVLTSSPRSIG